MQLDGARTSAKGQSDFSKRMYYGFITLVLSVSLSFVFVIATDASIWAKLLVAGLLLISVFALSHLPMIKILIQAVLGLSLAFYFKARYDIS